MSFSKPIYRDSKIGWYGLHRTHVNTIVRQQAKVVLLGASIVRNLSRYPSVWDRHLQSFNTVNCGIGGDKTQHVLWRAENLYLPISVHVVVIHCGTNNIDHEVYTPHDIAHGVVSCGVRLREKSPHLKVIIAGILPMDLNPSKRRRKIQQTNDKLKQLCCDEGITFIEQASYWSKDSGKLNQKLFRKDNLHPNKEGCNMFARTLASAINASLTPTLTPTPTPTPTPSPTPTPTPTPTPNTHIKHPNQTSI